MGVSTEPNNLEVSFDTHPDAYKHFTLAIEGTTATLTLDVELRGGLRPDYELKLNSYDLGVDIELADAVQRLRFTHPHVKVVVVKSGIDRCFCAGANIPMLGSSTHAFKVNFCKFTNETRLYIEDASRGSGQKYLAALNGTCAGGGYELALACDDILLVDDGSSAVSLPEVPLLAVLPGTGGLTRLVDKRKVRRDLADVFCTTSEGVRGKRALDWGLVDAIAPRSKFDAAIADRVAKLAAQAGDRQKGPGIELDPLAPKVAQAKAGASYEYRHVALQADDGERTATLTVRGPEGKQPATGAEIQNAGAAQWSLRAFRELDDALLRLRFAHPKIGLVVLRTQGDAELVRKTDEALHRAAKENWLANEIALLQARVMRRLDVSSRTIFALAEKGSCFVGSLFELALASDRIYMLADDAEAVAIGLTAANAGPCPTYQHTTRLEQRFYGAPQRTAAALERRDPITAQDAEKLGLVTAAIDEIDWDDDVRVAVEERASLSPDALTGMEASLRFPGEETMESKIFARLSAWQNWIFQRPNAVGPTGALTKYGQPDRPVFDWNRC